jgi:hypothetical protein
MKTEGFDVKPRGLAHKALERAKVAYELLF